MFFKGSKRLTVILFLIFVVVFPSCKSCKPGGKGISEGIIEYDAEVLDKNNPMADLAPDKMIVKFKDNKSSVDLSAGMGLFSTTFISDPDTKTMLQLVKLLNKKFAYIMDSTAVKKEIDSAGVITIEKTSETKTIAKFKCKKARVTFPGNTHPPYDVWYTNEINIQDPNWSNPYKEIDGVLMEYQMNRYGLAMKFTAKNVTKADVDDTSFELPDEYKLISKEEMDELFKAFQ